MVIRRRPILEKMRGNCKMALSFSSTVGFRRSKRFNLFVSKRITSKRNDFDRKIIKKTSDQWFNSYDSQYPCN